MAGLGIGEEIQITRQELAVVQLTEAISLFLAEKYIPAITLAGAAEEILGTIVERGGGVASMNAALDLIDRIREQHPGLKVLDGQTRANIRDRWNQARNQLKHLKDGINEVTLNPLDEAWYMIGRALNNAVALGISISNRSDFENWVIEKVAMQREQDD